MTLACYGTNSTASMNQMTQNYGAKIDHDARMLSISHQQFTQMAQTYGTGLHHDTRMLWYQ